jgi:hypothetical protein
VSYGIGLDELRSEFHKHRADRRLAAGNAAGEAEFQQELLTIKSACRLWSPAIKPCYSSVSV